MYACVHACVHVNYTVMLCAERWKGGLRGGHKTWKTAEGARCVSLKLSGPGQGEINVSDRLWAPLNDSTSGEVQSVETYIPGHKPDTMDSC